MKYILPLILATITLASCASGPLTKEQAIADSLSAAAATVNGFIAGGQAGAVAGLTLQEVKNLNALAEKAKAAASSPAPPQTPASAKASVVVTP